MPENWSLPTITSNYATGVIQAINNKFTDAITLFRGGLGTNLPVNAIQFSGDLDGTFMRWNGSAWNNMKLGVAGGGTGADNPSLARTNLGLGTMSTQNSNLVDITGGSIVNLSTFSSNSIYANVLSSPDGSNIGNLNGANIATGIINPARLGNGVANNTVYLRGDSLWAAPAGTFPSGLIVISHQPCPPGWSRVGWDGVFLRVGSVFSTAGGSYPATHSHTQGSLALGSHSHSAGSYQIGSHNHGGSTGSVNINVSMSGTTGGAGSHAHHFSDSFSGNTGGESSGIMNVDAGQSGNMTRGPHTHSFSGSVDADTDTVGNHAHSFSASGSGSGAGSIPNQSAVGVSGTSGAATAGLSGSTDEAFHLPPFFDVLLCMKD